MGRKRKKNSPERRKKAQKFAQTKNKGGLKCAPLSEAARVFLNDKINISNTASLRKLFPSVPVKALIATASSGNVSNSRYKNIIEQSFLEANCG